MQSAIETLGAAVAGRAASESSQRYALACAAVLGSAGAWFGFTQNSFTMTGTGAVTVNTTPGIAVLEAVRNGVIWAAAGAALCLVPEIAIPVVVIDLLHSTCGNAHVGRIMRRPDVCFASSPSSIIAINGGAVVRCRHGRGRRDGPV